MFSTVYLYGIEADYLKNKDYKEALLAKYKAGKILEFRLTQNDIHDSRIERVTKALKHTKRLLKEIGVTKLPTLSEALQDEEIDNIVDRNINYAEELIY